jgi:hypothetical protein
LVFRYNNELVEKATERRLIMTYTPTIKEIEQICTYATYIITAASALANLLPHPEKAEGVLAKISKVVNFIALNITKLKKEG